MNSDSKVVTGRMENGGEILRNREVEELGETCWVLVVHTRGSGGGIWERIRSLSKTWSAITTQGLVDTSLLHFVGPTGLEGPWFHLFSIPFWMLGSSSLQWAAVRGHGSAVAQQKYWECLCIMSLEIWASLWKLGHFLGISNPTSTSTVNCDFSSQGGGTLNQLSLFLPLGTRKTWPLIKGMRQISWTQARLGLTSWWKWAEWWDHMLPPPCNWPMVDSAPQQSSVSQV